MEECPFLLRCFFCEPVYLVRGAPDAWGPDLPVDPQMYEHLPANWHGVCLGDFRM